jgi:hypothetical protein
MTLLTGWPLEIGVDDILRGQGANPIIVHSSKPMLVIAAERARAEGLSLVHPVAMTREIGVREFRHEQVLLENDCKLTGSLITRHLVGAQRLVAVICTIGPELENTVSRLLGEDSLYALALDGLGNAAVESLSQQICAHIGTQIRTETLTASTPLSPGSPEWPVEIGQPQIFALLDPAKAGVSLTSGGMMVPKKSMSFIVGIGSDMSQAGLCVVCSLKETCRYQHA